MRNLKIGRWISPGAAVSVSAALVALSVPTALTATSDALPASAASAAKASSKPPSAATEGATQVSGSAATLNGTVNPRGAESSCYFQYGATTAYGAQTPTVGVGNGAVQVKVSQPISGLQLGTTYHYRVVVVTSTGTIVTGQDRVFTTRKIPLKLKLAKLLGPVPYRGRFTIEGVLEGTGASGHQVVLQNSPFPYLGGFSNIGGPLFTSAAGLFSFSVAGLTQNTELRVATLDSPPISSGAMTVHVAVRVTLHMRPTGRKGYVRLYGTVTPAVVGAPVAFQLIRPGFGPATAGGTVVKRASASTGRFSSVVFIRHGRGGPYRALVQVANGKLVSGSSPTVLLRSAPAPVRKGHRARTQHSRRR